MVENPAAFEIRWAVGWEGEEVLARVNRDGDFSFEPGMMHDRLSSAFVCRAMFQTSGFDEQEWCFTDISCMILFNGSGVIVDTYFERECHRGIMTHIVA